MKRYRMRSEERARAFAEKWDHYDARDKDMCEVEFDCWLAEKEFTGRKYSEIELATLKSCWNAAWAFAESGAQRLS